MPLAISPVSCGVAADRLGAVAGVKTTVNSIDVARLAGVSQSAVSRVFTPGASVSPRMREKVLNAATALGYHPNRLATSLLTHRSRLIGIALGYLGTFYYPLAIESMVRRLRRQGYQTMIFFTERGEAADETVELFLQYRVDGVILGSVALSESWVAACDQAGVPVILFNHYIDDPRVSAVGMDNFAAGRAAGELLLAGGHQRIAYLAGVEESAPQRDREAGLRQVLSASGMPLFDRAVGNFETGAATRAARVLFDRPAAERPDAIFVANDQMAIAVMDVLRFELGLRVPDDVSVVGFDDVPQAAWPTYDLTTVRQDVDTAVSCTVATLLDRIERPPRLPQRHFLPVEMIVRSSARLPANWRAGRLRQEVPHPLWSRALAGEAGGEG